MATVTRSCSISGVGTTTLRTYANWGDRPYMMLNGEDVTDHGRKTSFSLQRSQVKTVRRHTGRSGTYYPPHMNKLKISCEWAMLPDTYSHTYDGRPGRISLKTLCSSSSKIKLYIKKNDGTGYLSYDVFASSYSENLFLRRDFEGGVLYDIAMEFTEL